MTTEIRPEEVRRELIQLGQRLERSLSAALDPVAKILIEYARYEFSRLSTTGRSVSGITWGPLKRPRKGSPLGVITGAMRDSVKLAVKNKRIRKTATVFYTDLAARFFERYRKLLPRKLPRVVLVRMQEILANEIAKLDITPNS